MFGGVVSGVLNHVVSFLEKRFPVTGALGAETAARTVADALRVEDWFHVVADHEHASHGEKHGMRESVRHACEIRGEVHPIGVGELARRPPTPRRGT